MAATEWKKFSTRVLSRECACRRAPEAMPVDFLDQERSSPAMKGARHSEEQIIAILKQGEAGLTTAELCRQQGITEQTYYRWKAKYGGMDSGDAKKLRQLPSAS